MNRHYLLNMKAIGVAVYDTICNYLTFTGIPVKLTIMTIWY